MNWKHLAGFTDETGLRALARLVPW